MKAIEEKIRKRIKVRERIERGTVEEIQITKKEAEQLGRKKKIDNVRLIVVDRLRDMTKTDCFAYVDKNRSCYCLNKLYCTNNKCRFYRNDIKLSNIEKDIEEYVNNTYKKY